MILILLFQDVTVLDQSFPTVDARCCRLVSEVVKLACRDNSGQAAHAFTEQLKVFLTKCTVDLRVDFGIADSKAADSESAPLPRMRSSGRGSNGRVKNAYENMVCCIC